MEPANRSAATADLRWAPNPLHRVGFMCGIFREPPQRDVRVGFQPSLNSFGCMGWRLVERQIQRTSGGRHREPVEKGHKMHRHLAIVIDEEPATSDGIQGAKERAAAGDARRGHAPARPLHPHGANEWQEMQLRLVQIQQMTPALRCLPLGRCQRCQFPLCFWIRLASRRQSGTRPAPACLVEQAPDTGAGEDLMEPRGQKRGQQTNRPAGLDVARAGGD